MQKTIGLMVVVILLVGAVLGYYYMQENAAPVTPPPVVVAPPTVAPPPVEEVQAQPVQETVQPALPQLKDSDAVMQEVFTELLTGNTFKKYFRLEEIVRHIVVTIDNLPRKTAAERLFPTKPVSGKFITKGEEESLAIASKNAARYTPYVSIAETVDTKKLLATYSRYYPLFQRAYQELGYPTGTFNDRLVTVIDHLLDAPEIKGSVRLTQPHVLYQYANPALEGQSAGRKILMRMGRENAAKIKNKLREIRRELTIQFAKQLPTG